MLLEQGPVENLREDVRWIREAGHVVDRDHARAAQLAHLEELTVDMTRVLPCPSSRDCSSIRSKIFLRKWKLTDLDTSFDLITPPFKSCFTI